ncbi:glycosyltransferase family 4 protein [Candidatus Accumulibacter cognatus]|uniref:Mannosylfructose-phosphate synthase n=1 Tax=Candidatus Accumulibacter cognatus TaxID=2954383 RepID=A0A080MAG6_9PROT|nr:glycosyltransferase family 4 protein [Candidatus Accumulibacter cognatus]KFB77981.1 MAG: Mannosylfructose-phosphate synthase [Candidatus Accumulibacter cognatus]
MKVALLCSGLGNVYRGHEVFARDLFTLLGDSVDITLFKGGGKSAPREWVIDNIPRNAGCLDHVHVVASPKWAAAIAEGERCRIEGETFAYAALKPLLEGAFDVVHCLEREVCNIIYDNRHLFRSTPKILFSNGGAIPARDLPRCDFVQEHTELNLSYSAKGKSFMIPHGVDVSVFHPEVVSDFRSQHDIPQNAFVVISVGAIAYGHKRMDYVVKEVSAIKDAYLLIVGQETKDTAEIKALGKRLMGERIIFTKVQHSDLPKAYAAANVFTLGSVFETFGIVYIEAMAMGLPVICTNHRNQRAIVKEGIFIDMRQAGALTKALRDTDRSTLAALGQRGRKIVLEHYDLAVLKRKYIERYDTIASSPTSLPTYSFANKLACNARNVVRLAARLTLGRAE